MDFFSFNCLIYFLCSAADIDTVLQQFLGIFFQKNSSLMEEDLIIKPGEGALEEILEATGGHGAERAIDASANDQARQLAVRGTRDWGRIAFVGEGGTSTLNPSPDMIHGQKTIYGSWVTSLWKMEELTEHLVRWNIHPEKLITHEFPLEKAGEAYALMAGGNCGKVAVTFEK